MTHPHLLQSLCAVLCLGITSFGAQKPAQTDAPKGTPAAADRPVAQTGHAADPINRFTPNLPAPYTDEAPRPRAEWVQPLDATADARALFEKRILPIFNSAKPSSCTECHLSGVELKDYIFPDQEKTFAALLKGRLIDTAHPDNSKILEFISRRPNQPGLIGDEVRRQEFEAFRAWIHAAVKDPKVLATKPADSPAGPKLSAEVIRHARTDRVLSSFLENVWVEMGRCASCHSPEQNQRLVEKHGEFMSWIKPGDPLGTLRLIVESDLLDLDRPERSPLLTKPTLEKSHKGGRKMVTGDRSYLQFLAFAEDYGAIKTGRYAKAGTLPAPGAEVGRPTQMRLRITDIPERFAKLPLQADIFAWTDAGWSKRRVATASWLVNPKGSWWQFALTRLAPRGTNEADALSLKPGKYLIKIYVDQDGKLQRDPRAGMSEAELVGQVEVETSWRIAPKDNATLIRFPGRS
ncbi:MAG: hypothetical protein ABMA13_19055 [Chthoniobacteraceae bacterium]